MTQRMRVTLCGTRGKFAEDHGGHTHVVHPNGLLSVCGESVLLPRDTTDEVMCRACVRLGVLHHGLLLVCEKAGGRP